MDANTRLKKIFAAQNEAFKNAPYPSADARRDKLAAIKNQIRRYQDVLCDALNTDFDSRSPDESKTLDLFGSILALDHARAHLRRWMKPSKRNTELLFFSNSLKVMYQPKGVVGIIVPWNFPIYLAIAPLATSLSAGNRVMMKLPEILPATNAALSSLLGEIFSEDEVALFGEELADPNLFSALPFDHLIYTGSSQIGKIVMTAAAQNLTPVTLELGGKSPAVVFPDYNVIEAAKRITHGKVSNCGQVCVAPDYAMVPRASMDAFVAAVQENFNKLFPDPISQNHDYTSIVSDRRYARIQALIEDAKQKGAKVICCGEYQPASNTHDQRRMPLHIITECTNDMLILQEELFGPLLPVLPYDHLTEVIRYIQAQPRPLALYCFSYDALACQNVLQQTHSGGVTINDWGWHAVNHSAPFGGIGNSGMGNYHGEEGFRELSHAKTVFRRQRFFPIGLFYPPYGTWVQRWVQKFYLGTADPALQAKRLKQNNLQQ